jgi:hypothetical protein
MSTSTTGRARHLVKKLFLLVEIFLSWRAPEHPALRKSCTSFASLCVPPAAVLGAGPTAIGNTAVCAALTH